MKNNKFEKKQVWYLRFYEHENTAALLKANGNLGVKIIDEEDENEQKAKKH